MYKYEIVRMDIMMGTRMDTRIRPETMRRIDNIARILCPERLFARYTRPRSDECVVCERKVAGTYIMDYCKLGMVCDGCAYKVKLSIDKHREIHMKKILLHVPAMDLCSDVQRIIMGFARRIFRY